MRSEKLLTLRSLKADNGKEMQTLAGGSRCNGNVLLGAKHAQHGLMSICLRTTGTKGTSLLEAGDRFIQVAGPTIELVKMASSWSRLRL